MKHGLNTDEAGTGLESTGQAGSDNELKADTRLMLFTHGALFVVLAYLLIGYVDDAILQHQGILSGSLPDSFMRVLNISRFIKDHALLVVGPITIVAFWADAVLYSWCRRRRGTRGGRLWFGAGVGLLAAFIIYCLWGLGALGRVLASAQPS